MEKKFKFSDKDTASKIIYLTVIAILCVSAIVIGIVAANNRKKTDDAPNPPASDGVTNDTGNSNGGATDTKPPENTEEDNKPKPLSFESPVVGTVMKSHSTTVPVFSNTLDEWRIHTGLDIMADEGTEVLAAAGGEVTGVYQDPMLGKTVEITHTETHKTYYSNLDSDSIAVSVGDIVRLGDKIGNIGDTTVSEMADEPHLHFEMYVSGASVNPLDYFTEESKKESLGIVSGEYEA
jgi:murein DD-endopeptidase MepM/ murein hydrolase activator NlpD